MGAKFDVLRVVLLFAIFLALPPIIAVSLYFFLFHSLGEMRKTRDNLQKATPEFSWKSIVVLYAPASIPALLGAGTIIAGVFYGYVPIYLAAGLAVAFIIPHMIPVERLLVVGRIDKN